MAILQGSSNIGQTRLVEIVDVDTNAQPFPIIVGKDDRRQSYIINLGVRPPGINLVPQLGELWWIEFRLGDFWTLITRDDSDAVRGLSPGDTIVEQDLQFFQDQIDEIESDVVELQDFDELLTLRRRRANRTSGNYGTGDSDWLGTLSVVEDEGGISGAGTTAVPFVVPVAGSYAITFILSGSSFTGASAAGLNVNGLAMWVPLQTGTVNASGISVVQFLPAFGTIVLRVRNNSGGAVNGVTGRCEIVKESSV